MSLDQADGLVRHPTRQAPQQLEKAEVVKTLADKRVGMIFQSRLLYILRGLELVKCKIASVDSGEFQLALRRALRT